MARNLILNICIDEDSLVSVEKTTAGEWSWLSFFLADGVERIDSKEELFQKLDEWIVEAKSKWDDTAYLESLDEAVLVFKEQLEELLSHPTEDGLEMGWASLQFANWAVEVDDNFGILICLDAQETEE